MSRWSLVVGRSLAAVVVATCALVMPRAQEHDPTLTGLDLILDTYVRDCDVYYHALKSDRGKLDGYVASLAAVQVDKATRAEQIAFWINAYNALVLRTVIDHYPIGQRSNEYPARSVRQIPGAFEGSKHQVADRKSVV